MAVTACSSNEAASVPRDGSIVPVGQRVASVFVGAVTRTELLDRLTPIVDEAASSVEDAAEPTG